MKWLCLAEGEKKLQPPFGIALAVKFREICEGDKLVFLCGLLIHFS
jgi:hypothetical protein